MAIGVALGLMAIYSCSLIVSTNDQQCQSDNDCALLASGSTCDKAHNVCLAPPGSTSSTTTSSTSSSGSSCDVDGGIGAGGCSSCAPTDNNTLLNHCTDGCFAFDNGRVKDLAADGGLPQLPNPPPDGGM
jgi:hypothetical protein